MFTMLVFTRDNGVKNKCSSRERAVINVLLKYKAHQSGRYLWSVFAQTFIVIFPSVVHIATKPFIQLHVHPTFRYYYIIAAVKIMISAVTYRCESLGC